MNGGPGRPESPPVAPLHVSFERAARLNPDAIAVAGDGPGRTYSEVDGLASSLAARLGSVGRCEPVGLAARSLTHLAVGCLAILKAGGACLPLDLRNPPARLKEIVGIAGATTVLAEREAAPLFEDEARVLALDGASPDGGGAGSPGGASDLSAWAYVVFTSGSTGQPKGIAMPHRGIGEVVAWQTGVSGPAAERTLQFAAPGFDVFFQEVFSTWAAAATLVSLGADRHDVAALAARLGEQRITRLFLPPALLTLLAEEVAAEDVALPDLREVSCAGERLLITAAVREMFSRHPDCALWNHYGPSETHLVTALRVEGPPGRWPLEPPIGPALPFVDAAVVDADMEEVPRGAPGELLLGGSSLADGYVGRPDLTAERFVDFRGRRMYRSGDEVVERDGGVFEFLGRIDDQVKVRGYRVEPKEIEAAALDHPGVREVAVVAAGEGVAQQLVCFVVPRTEANEELARAIVALLRERLPEFMVPARVVFRDALPLSTNGKVARRALMASIRPDSESRDDAAGGDPAAEVARLCSEVLGRAIDDPGESLVALGAHSLQIAEISARLRRRWRVDVAPRRLLEWGSVERIAAEVASAAEVAPAAEVATGRDAPLQPSVLQEPLLAYELMFPASTALEVGVALDLGPGVDLDRLGAAVSAAARAHRVLRSSYELSADGFVVAVADDAPVSLRVHAVDAERWRERDGAVRRPDLLVPLDVGDPPPIAVDALSHGDATTVVVRAHHAVCDGWSMRLLLNEIAAAYAASPPLDGAEDYFSFVARHHRMIEGRHHEWEDAWARLLEGAPHHPALFPGAGAEEEGVALAAGRAAPEVADAIRADAAARSTTILPYLAAAAALALGTVTGAGDVVLGCPFSLRDATTSSTLGHFVNVLPLRVRLAPASTLRELVAGVAATIDAVYDVRHLPADRLPPPPGAVRWPPFTVTLQVEEDITTNAPLGLAGAVATVRELLPGEVQFGVILRASTYTGEISLKADYKRVYGATQVETVVARWGEMLGRIAAAPASKVGSVTPGVV